MSDYAREAFRVLTPIGKALHDRVWPALLEAQQTWKDVIDFRIRDWSGSFDPMGERGPTFPTIFIEVGRGKTSVAWTIESRELGMVTTGKFYGARERWSLTEINDDKIKALVEGVVYDSFRAMGPDEEGAA